MRKKIKKLSIATVIVLVVFFGFKMIPLSFGDNQPSAKLIGNSLEQISQLATLEYDYTYVDEFSNSNSVKFFNKEFHIPFTQKHFICAFDGMIKYGIDLSEIENIKVDDKNKKIVIEMPTIMKISHEIDWDSIRYYDEKSNLFNPITCEDIDAFKKEHMKDAEKQAMERGIINKVQDYTENVIQLFIQNTYEEFKDYTIECKYEEQTTIKKGNIQK